MYEVKYDLTVHIRGTVFTDAEPDICDDLLDYVFPDGWEGEILGVSGEYEATECED